MIRLKTFKTAMVLIGCLAWVPLAILAYLLSPHPHYIKLSILAAASFVSMFLLFLKTEG